MDAAALDRLAGNDKERLVNLANCAEQAERYEDMVMAMAKVVRVATTEPLTAAERNLLSVAYKNVVGGLRNSWRVISAMYDKAQSSEPEKRVNMIAAYRSKIEAELRTRCDDVLELVSNNLLKNLSNSEQDDEDRAFYHKMIGDYYRYLAEVTQAGDKKDITDKCKEAYDEALKISTDKLQPTNPIRLGLALNYSVFYYEILNDGAQACHLAKKAFDEAMAELDNLKADSHKDTTLIMQLIRDNLTLWTSECEVEQEEAA